ncbi:MAG: hypothetical protein ACI9GB_003882 [Halioglobus sp.]|jgi:hypothetical protein
MYQSCIANDIMFIRHYGTFKGAESLVALISTLESNAPNDQLKGVLFDFRDVTYATLANSDRAYGEIFASELERYGQDISLPLIVSVYDPENVALFDIVTDRNQRLSLPVNGSLNFRRIYSHPEALEILGLPAGYCIEYPPVE